jgi:hypothetical protein
MQTLLQLGGGAGARAAGAGAGAGESAGLAATLQSLADDIAAPRAQSTAAQLRAVQVQLAGARAEAARDAGAARRAQRSVLREEEDAVRSEALEARALREDEAARGAAAAAAVQDASKLRTLHRDVQVAAPPAMSWRCIMLEMHHVRRCIILREDEGSCSAVPPHRALRCP